MSTNDKELMEARTDLAWKWFEFHASQRAALYNWFLVVTGVLVNGYVFAVKDGIFGAAAVISVFGIFESLSFLVFDLRNRKLTEYAEDILEKIERDSLFGDEFAHDLVAKGHSLGLLKRDREDGMRQDQPWKWQRLTKMCVFRPKAPPCSD
jgi:hypothetical protein